MRLIRSGNCWLCPDKRHAPLEEIACSFKAIDVLDLTDPLLPLFHRHIEKKRQIGFNACILLQNPFTAINPLPPPDRQAGIGKRSDKHPLPVTGRKIT